MTERSVSTRMHRRRRARERTRATHALYLDGSPLIVGSAAKCKREFDLWAQIDSANVAKMAIAALPQKKS